MTVMTIDDLDMQERFVRGSGPGGQNVNKVATAVELRVDIAASSLPDAVKARLATLAGRRMTTDGMLIIDSREHRTQAENREAARERLRALLDRALTPPRRRKATRPKASAREKRLAAKKHRGTTKASRRAASDE